MVKRKKRFGDRYDGRLIRSADPFFRIIPYVMKTRTDAMVFFDERLDLEPIETYLKMKRYKEKKKMSFLQVAMAALVRTISQKPAVNRFVAGQKIYARNEILISLAVKRELTEDSPETTIKFKFDPTDTIDDVAEKVNVAIEESKKDQTDDTDATAKIIGACPGFIIRFIVWFMGFLDYHRKMPKTIYKASPFHTSIFITDLGSLGIEPVYHHIYNFGTTSIFIAFGTKHKEKVIDKDNNIVERKFINLRIVGDERIVDGFYFASAFKLFKKLMMHPEALEVPPEKVIKDME
ncbi:MAG: 2-oxo acid dehydrogenase subunit E2 [Clostridiales bacterium]|nr:2-oxo acid dehydrogenase subunit E2 [Clostridiales bacterium]